MPLDGQDRFRGCLLGLAVGDAVGTTVEFRARGSFRPVTDMVGGGPFDLEPGQWTDDTSMALCLAASLLERREFDPRDQMERYSRWQREGYLSSNGRCFDIGTTVRAALAKYSIEGNPYAGSTDPMAAGNGCIMRLAPIPLFFFPNVDSVERNAGESSRTTHGAAECVDASRLFGRWLARALLGQSKDEILSADSESFTGASRIKEIAGGHWRDKLESDIRGSGYVVHSLEAAAWCFWRTSTYRDAVLTAVNLGEDADTTAAVCGQLAGAHYGVPGIPAEWLGKLAFRDLIQDMADSFWSRASAAD